MNFKELIFPKKEKKPSVFRYESSYSFLIYSDSETGKAEEIWNATNIEPPRYVYSKDNKSKLCYSGVHPGKMHLVSPALKVGDRYITYKTPEEFVRERKKLAKLYWESGYNQCREKYLDFDEFFALSCKSMNKPRFQIKEVTEND